MSHLFCPEANTKVSSWGPSAAERAEHAAHRRLGSHAEAMSGSTRLRGYQVFYPLIATQALSSTLKTLELSLNKKCLVHVSSYCLILIQTHLSINMSFSPNLLAGKVGLVTGAGSPYGIGRSLVLALAQAGAKAVYATDLTLANVPSLQKEVEETGSACQIHGKILDVVSEEQTVAVLKEILAEQGQLDFFFANAGFGTYK